MGSLSLFTCQRALKMGYFYWLCIKSLNHLHTDLNLGYPKDTKFYLESKASFIAISSIASFKLFLIAWLREYCTFLDSFMVSQKSLPWPKYTHLGTIFQLLSNFFLLQTCSLLHCSQQIHDKKIGGHRACSREKENLFRHRAQLEEIFHVLYMHVLMCVR